MKDERPDVPDDVTSWLGRLVLLYGAPFHYLIPEEQMLPKESIRFFFLDPIWIQSLVQGACSVGNTGYGDTIIDSVINKWVQPNQPGPGEQSGLANKAAAEVRDRLRNQFEGVHLNLSESELQVSVSKLKGKPQDILKQAMGKLTKEQRDKLRTDLREVLRDLTQEQKEKLYRDTGVQNEEQLLKLLKESEDLDWPLTGFLLRSAVVEGWRGLEVMGYKKLSDEEKQNWPREGLTQEQKDKLKNDGAAPLKPLRIEQLSSDLMLGIFNGMIGQLVIRQPQEGLHFGLTVEKQSYIKKLREMGYKDPAKAGEILQDKTIDLSRDNLMRDQKKSRGVINIGKLAAKMKDTLGKGRLKDGKFTSAEFAVEMIEAAGEFTFQPNDKKSS